jgi:hypothetical protein
VAHLTGQNIHTTQGDTENISVSLDLSDAPGMDISTCDFDWAVYRQTTKEIVLEKTTGSGIIADSISGLLLISIDRGETRPLLGHYLHICKMVDMDDQEFTSFTGTFDVDESPI